MALLARTRDRYPYDRMLSHEFPLGRIDEAFEAADAFRGRTSMVRATILALVLKPFHAGRPRRGYLSVMGDIERYGRTPRASDADRDRVASQLREHVAEGRITVDELSSRLELVYRARTVGDLEKLMEDLPAPPEETRRGRRAGRRLARLRHHVRSYVIVNLFLVGVWAASGRGYFWPIWPMMGWGIGLALHAWGAVAGGHHPEPEDGALDEARGARERAERHRERAERRREHWDRRLERRQARFGSWPPQPATTVLQQSPAPGLHWVAVMFTDIADSTRLTEAMGDEEWSRVRARHRALVQDCFAANSGNEVGSQGDGFLARFPGPVDATRCAISIQRRLQEQRDATGFAPKVRIGIHAGRVVEESDDLVGSVVNLASRVTAEAEPGEILITEPVADHLGPDVRVEDRGLRTLRGVSQARHLLAIDWARR